MQSLIFVLIFFASLSAHAQMGPDLPGRGSLFPGLGAGSGTSVQTYYDQSFARPSTVGMDEWGGRVRSTVFKQNEDRYSANASFDDLQVNDNLTIPSWNGHAGFTVPRGLYGASLGGAWDRHLQNADDLSVSFGIGSDSDQLFAGLRETTLHVTGFYRLPMGPHGAWNFFLNYSNNRTILNGLPLPGAMYSYVDLEKRLTVLAGFPIVFVGYGLTELWDVRASFFLTESILLESGFKIPSALMRLFLRYELQKRPYLRASRDDLEEQLIFQEQRVSGGLQIPLAKSVFMEVNTGYEFGRSFYEAERQQPSSASATLVDDWFAKIQISYRLN